MKSASGPVKLLCRCSRGDFAAWGETAGRGLDALAGIQHAAVTDMAERLAPEERSVIVNSGEPGDDAALRSAGAEAARLEHGEGSAGIARIVQRECARSGSTGVLFRAAPDPLYTLADMRVAAELLASEEEVL